MSISKLYVNGIAGNEGFVDSILTSLGVKSKLPEPKKRPPCKKASKGGYFQAIKLRKHMLDLLKAKYPKIAKAIITPLPMKGDINDWFDVDFEDVPDSNEAYHLFGLDLRKCRSLPTDEYRYIVSEQVWEATKAMETSLPENVYLEIDASGDDISYDIYFKK